tara:strand:- start:245 stop:592 length:348 start_codon:yes stop_codon:yes gene_type:complete
MQDTREQYFEHHVFCCLNERKIGHKRGSCLTAGAQPLFNYFKARMKELGYKGRVRTNKAGCLDRCELGPVMVVYPEGVWYTYQSIEDIEEIIASHFQQGRVVTRLQLTNDMVPPA